MPDVRSETEERMLSAYRVFFFALLCKERPKSGFGGYDSAMVERWGPNLCFIRIWKLKFMYLLYKMIFNSFRFYCNLQLHILLLFIHYLLFGTHPVAAVVTCYISTDYEDFTLKFR